MYFGYKIKKGKEKKGEEGGIFGWRKVPSFSK